MNGNTVTLSGVRSKTLTADNLLGEVDLLYKALDQLRAKIINSLPARYGSDAWWEKTERKSREDYAAGRYITLKNKGDVDKFFQKSLQK